MASDISGHWFHKSTITSRDINKLTVSAMLTRFFFFFFYYQPFSMTDLLNWKQHSPSCSKKPQAVTGLLESIFQTYRPSWGDCLQYLLTLFNTEGC